MERHGTERHVYSAPLYTLIRTLVDFANDRESHGKTARANEARRCAAELEAGARSVDFERVTYEVGTDGRYTAWRGPRDAVVAELHDASTGWAHFGKMNLAADARAAAGAIAAEQTDSVQVGRIVYQVA
jgi:hypothetical protein